MFEFLLKENMGDDVMKKVFDDDFEFIVDVIVKAYASGEFVAAVKEGMVK